MQRKQKMMQENSETGETNFVIDRNDIPFGRSDSMNIMQNGTPYSTVFSCFLEQFGARYIQWLKLRLFLDFMELKWPLTCRFFYLDNFVT